MRVAPWTGGDEGLKGADKAMLDELSLEIYEMKIQDYQDKLMRCKQKCDQLIQENDSLAKAQSKFTHDKQDIVEFLNIKVQEHEKQITVLEQRIVSLDDEKKDIKLKAAAELDSLSQNFKVDYETLSMTCAKYKQELDQLSDFRSKKADMEQSLVNLQNQLEAKDKKFKDEIQNMERKILQDKNLMKKEMLQKVNEAVASFRRVADQQMAETTKRAIRENMAITSQLKKMSTKTVELISTNEDLNKKMAKLKTTNALLVESEQELAKKNQANQRVIKMLVEKLKESDKMLELAYESAALEDQEGTGSFDQGAYQGENEYRGSDDQYFDPDHEKSIEEQQAEVARDLEIIVENLHDLVDGITKFLERSFEINSAEVVEMDPLLMSIKMEAEDFWRRLNVIRSQLQGNASVVRLDEIPSNTSEPHHEDIDSRGSPEQVRPSSQPALMETAPMPVAKVPGVQPAAAVTSPSTKVKSMPQRRAPRDLAPILAVISKAKDDSEEFVLGGMSADRTRRSVSTQTRPLPFSESVTSKFLLTDLRPWGPPAQCLPKKGAGLFVAKPLPKLAKPMQ
ncbi:uncharacterized protein BJ171DRAFT_485041 [Polychytrium aggregatum]|uniref:uncharacterized protein n=1 Tax=Polychytrium aggregatum TaxID=110093 RepID=UPI0022FED17D|nr:uncharacterized protein BJ171DRAFT_485041 [Polychytrium aggregatum]KAI9209794.1 hypothetical protein BJ171DRAFT_485041 [Polychytrium aggregatum]